MPSFEKDHDRIKQERKRAAELPRRLAEREGYEDTPAPIEFVTSDGKFYLARIVTRGQLDSDGRFLKNCFAKTHKAQMHGAYVLSLYEGDLEIFTIRKVSDGKPVVAIRYNVDEHKVVEIKGKKNQLITKESPYFAALQEALDYINTGTAYDEHNKPFIRGMDGNY